MVISPPETGSDVLNYVGGALVPARAGAWIESLNPSTGALHVRCPASEAADVSAAVEAASAAFASWSATTVEARSAVMMRVADAIEANLEAFALCESRDQGKPVSLARSVDIPRAVKNFRFFATAILHERHGATTAPGIIHVESPMPIGVCGLVSPWNLPLYLLTWKIAPCMAAGCTMVAKPSELTPATASMLAQVMIEVQCRCIATRRHAHLPTPP
jgi:aminomuconate-semialdehyde/2-hydroxymuconate-6-semialdehyde dehydrogenase